MVASFAYLKQNDEYIVVLVVSVCGQTK